MKICFATSEMVPFAKTGGLADVAGALPVHLREQGHDVRVFMPRYSTIDTSDLDLTPVEFLTGLNIHLGPHRFEYSVYVTHPSEDSDLDVYLIHCPQLYYGPNIYTGEIDDHLRFALLSGAAIECCQRMGWGPDIFHCNDWHTALIPIYLKSVYSWDKLFSQTKSILTIHNIAYQGVYPVDVLPNLGLDKFRQLLFQLDLDAGHINFLKTGVLYADAITTVSHTYAREIQGDEAGKGLGPLLRERSSSVVGIVNGVDYSVWSPESDPYIPRNYGIEDVAEGKAENQQHLLQGVGLDYDEEAPVLGIVSRLTSQKGFELTFDPLPQALQNLNIRLVVLGTGEQRLEEHFQWLQSSFPNKVCYYRGYSEELAHLIEAGADIFLMPSLFEPCGLNQMYSLKYGTVPIVRKTGGLADTVQLWNPETGEGTGFVFDHYDSTGFGWALKAALTTYQDQEAWGRLQRNGMEQDFSWQRQGGEYEKLYQALI